MFGIFHLIIILLNDINYFFLFFGFVLGGGFVGKLISVARVVTATGVIVDLGADDNWQSRLEVLVLTLLTK